MAAIGKTAGVPVVGMDANAQRHSSGVWLATASQLALNRNHNRITLAQIGATAQRKVSERILGATGLR